MATVSPLTIPFIDDLTTSNFSKSAHSSSIDNRVGNVAKQSMQQPNYSNDLSSVINSTFGNLNQINEDRIRDIIGLQQENNSKIRALQDLKQKIRMSGETIDWSSNEENKALLQKCKEYGLIVAEGKFTFTKEEKEALLLNADATQDRYSLSSEETKLRLSQMFNVKTQTIEMWVNLIQKCHEMAMAIVRNLRS